MKNTSVSNQKDLLAEIHAFNNVCRQLEKLIADNPIFGIAAHYRFKSGLINDRPTAERDSPRRKSKSHKKLRRVVANPGGNSSRPGSGIKSNGKSGSRPTPSKATKRGRSGK